MKMKNVIGILLSLLTLVIVGCGGGDGGTPITPITVDSTAVALQGNGSATSTITANMPAATPVGTVVNFTITSGNGTLSAATAPTIAGGTASVTLTATSPGAVTVAAASSTFAGTATVTFATANTIVVTRNPSTVITGGTSVISAQLPTATAGVTIGFTTTSGTLSAATAVTNAAGLATVSAQANLLTGSSAAITVITVPTKAIVKLAISGTLPAGTTIDGAQFVLNYVTNKGLSILDAGIVASGGATASLIVNNLTVNGTIQSAFANANATPIATQTGEFATLTFTITGATVPFPALGDFTIASSSVATTPVLATPLTVTVLSVTLQ
jgi:hypothetical protein